MDKSRINYFTDFFTDYDFLCFVETKLDHTDIVSFLGFNFLSQPRREPVFRGSGGIALFVKDEISEYCTDRLSDSDYIVWVCLDMHLTGIEENVVLGIVYMYVPPSQSRFYNDDELLKLENENRQCVARTSKSSFPVK